MIVEKCTQADQKMVILAWNFGSATVGELGLTLKIDQNVVTKMTKSEPNAWSLAYHFYSLIPHYLPLLIPFSGPTPRKNKQYEEEIVSISSNTDSENESVSDEESSKESDSGREDGDDDSKSSYKPHSSSVDEEEDSPSVVDFDESEDNSEEEESEDEISKDCEVNTG